ncbi:MAG TPA: phosphatase PAP2 family protein [Acidobacteriaceae bacterium]|nr:phosphatase PAP2 family protein [Acidobacteriaceae bacterium]
MQRQRSLLALVFAFALPALAQANAPVSQAPAPQTSQDCALSALPTCVKHVAQDEFDIVTSPVRVRPHDLLWIAPFGLATAVTIHFDTDAMRDIGIHPSRQDSFENYSDAAGLYAPFATSAVFYFAGNRHDDSYMKETAVLSAEAMADAGILNEGLKYAIDREGPMVDNAKGDFWPRGIKGWPNSPSMPSEHAMNVWAFAHVVAGQYNGVATNLVVYGLATTVSVSRVYARQHFPSDVLVGSTLGWITGGYVLHRRSHEHGMPDISTVETPLGRGVGLTWNLNRGD